MQELEEAPQGGERKDLRCLIPSTPSDSAPLSPHRSCSWSRPATWWTTSSLRCASCPLWRMPLSSPHLPVCLTAAWRLQEILSCSPACKCHCIHHRNDPPWAWPHQTARAYSPPDQIGAQVTPFLEAGDIIIDGGNSHFPDSDRRTKELEAKGLLFIGTGVSGGEEGALLGPSIMPGGSPAAWEHVKPIFQAISARVEDGSPCCEWVGNAGAGHYVKMVHNGIEYGDMQIICECYQIMRDVLKIGNAEIAQVRKPRIFSCIVPASSCALTYSVGILAYSCVFLSSFIFKYGVRILVCVTGASSCTACPDRATSNGKFCCAGLL